MREAKAPASIWQGSFRVFGVEVRSHVLDNGQRIIDAESMADLFKAMATPDAMIDEAELIAFARWQKGEPCAHQPKTEAQQ